MFTTVSETLLFDNDVAFKLCTLFGEPRLTVYQSIFPRIGRENVNIRDEAADNMIRYVL